MKVVAIIQARMGSTRLPGKVAKEIYGKSILEHIIDRIKKVNKIDEIVVATSENDKDDLVEDIANKNKVSVFRGSEDDVLSRFYYSAEKSNADIVLRFTADNPLIDINIINETIEAFNIFLKYGEIDYLSNCIGYPLGMGIEIFTFNALKEAFVNAKKTYEREHVTPYLYDVNNNFKNKKIYCSCGCDNIRVTIDTIEDFMLVTEVFDELYKDNNYFGLKEILDLFKRKPTLSNINKDVVQKTLQ